MTKLRVHELAKELDKTNKEVMDVLKEKQVDVKSHMSTLSEEEIDLVKKSIGGAKEDRSDAPKKKNIVQVFRPQNTQSGGGRQGGRQRQNQNNNNNGNAGRRNDGEQKFQKKGRPDNAQGRDDSRRDNRQGDNRAGRPTGQGRRDDSRRDNRQGENRGERRDNFRGNENRGEKRDGFRGDNRRDNDRRDNFRGNDGRGGDGRRDGGRRDNSRRDCMPAIPAPAVAEQKPQRQKAKDNYKSKKEKDYRNNNEEQEERMSKLSKPGKKQSAPQKPQPKEEKQEEQVKVITVPETITIQELAEKMKLQPSAIVKKLFMQGKIVTVNQEVDFDTAEEIAMEFDCLVEKEEVVDVIEELLKEEEEDEKKMKKRPPVVCVMGHVDHGKTSLLDAIRETHVTAKESGGITQKIGAYMVDVDGQKITFLDTPGHEAFTAMRMRGAQATDIAILVVAADDGVMPQTIEAINHAKAAGVEIIVAVNKIDKPNANIEKVKQELTEYELIAEDWGGSTTFVPVSAHTKEGIDELLEMILLTAEVNELKANPNRKARGIVIEAELDKGRGPVATILVQKGTLRVGDAVAAGSCYGKIRAMIDDTGRRVKEATPSMPVEILGLNDVPNAGEIIMATESEKEARNIADTFIAEGKKKLLDDTKHKVSLDALFEQIQAGNMKELDLIIKADVQGSVEAVKQSLVKLSNEEVIVKVIHGGVGNINESDVVLASASNAIIIGFNVKPDNQARIVAEREKVDLRLYSVIYNAIEDVEAALKGMLEPIYEEKIIGHAEIRQIFKASGVGNIAGAIVTEGRITKDSIVRITRDKEQIYEGPIATLKHFKDDVKEVKGGSECGMVFENFGQIQEGDLVEAHIMVEVPR